MIDPNTPDPFVYPKTTTWYTATLDQSGCINNDSLRVRVVDKVTLYAGDDSTICLGDTILLNPSGDGLYFNWSPVYAMDNPKLKNPHVSPAGNTTYTVVASIGKCNSTGSVNIKTIPYPLSNAGPDAFICWNDTIQLNATAKGTRFVWLPTTNLSDPTI